MITIPTGELTGILADVATFASPDDEILKLHSVHVEWDGEALHTMATDRYVLGWSRWFPSDIGPGEETQDDLFTQWGGTDDPWVVDLALPDAKELVKVFKLPSKEGRVPLTLTFDQEGDKRRLVVSRGRETGYSGITIVAEDTDAGFVDVREMLAKAAQARSVEDVVYAAEKLAGFAKVRPYGPMRLRFTGAEKLTHVSIGERFTGAIIPLRAE